MPVSFAAYPEDVQKVIYNVKPGLSGIGSIVFRDEEELITQVKESGGDAWDFYQSKIYPFKGKLEQWYQDHQSFKTDFYVIIATIVVVIFPSLDAMKMFFPSVPKRNF